MKRTLSYGIIACVSMLAVMRVIRRRETRPSASPAHTSAVGTSLAGKEHADIRTRINTFANSLVHRNELRTGRHETSTSRMPREKVFTRFYNRVAEDMSSELVKLGISGERAEFVLTLFTLDNLAAMYAAPVLAGEDRLATPSEITEFRGEVRSMLEEVLGLEQANRLLVRQDDASLAEAATAALQEIEAKGQAIDDGTSLDVVELLSATQKTGSIGNLIAAERVTMADVQAIRGERARIWQDWVANLPPERRRELSSLKQWYDTQTEKDIARTIEILKRLKSLEARP